MKEKKDFLINVAYYSIILLFVFLFGKFILPILTPFLIGFCVAFLINKLTKKIKKYKKITNIFCTIIFYGIVGFILSAIFLKIYSSIYDGILQIPNFYEDSLLPAFDIVHNYITSFVNELDPTMSSVINTLANSFDTSLNKFVSFISTQIVNFVSEMVTVVPTLFVNTIFTIISTFFFVIDYDKMNSFFETNAPIKIKETIAKIKEYLFNTLFVVLRSYALIMLLTFTELSIMFSICGIDNAFLIAGIIAIFDILPVLGTGGIIIPWAIISLILGNYVLGIELIVIYIIVTVIRNFAEPKIVGVQLGLHPIVTLVSMFVGLRLFGFLGLFGLPIAISYFWKKKKN